MYEEDVNGISQSLPFILVPNGEVMPSFLLIWEQRDTGEIEPGPNGEEIPIVEADLRQYARMDQLKRNLSASEYDRVREALGLEPLQVATRKGKTISSKVKSNISDE
jgi:hypothetical protein